MLTTVLFLLLTSEFIAESGNEKFWEFVDTVKELTVYKHGGMFIIQKYISFQLCLFFWSNVTVIIMLMFLTESVRSYYNLILKKAGQFLTDLQVSLLKFALSLRSYSPAIHASQQVCCDFNGMKFTLMGPDKHSFVIVAPNY